MPIAEVQMSFLPISSKPLRAFASLLAKHRSSHRVCSTEPAARKHSSNARTCSVGAPSKSEEPPISCCL